MKYGLVGTLLCLAALVQTNSEAAVNGTEQRSATNPSFRPQPDASTSPAAQLGRKPAQAARPGTQTDLGSHAASRPVLQTDATAESRLNQAIASDPSLTKLANDIKAAALQENSGPAKQTIDPLLKQISLRVDEIAAREKVDLSKLSVQGGQSSFNMPGGGVKAVINHGGISALQPAGHSFDGSTAPSGTSFQDTNPLVFEYTSFPGRSSTKTQCQHAYTKSASNSMTLNNVALTSKQDCDNGIEWRYVTIELPDLNSGIATIYLHFKRYHLYAGLTGGGGIHTALDVNSSLDKMDPNGQLCAVDSIDMQTPPSSDEHIVEDITAKCIVQLNSAKTLLVGPRLKLNSRTMWPTPNKHSTVGISEAAFDRIHVEVTGKKK